MKTQRTKLVFEKQTLVELQNDDLVAVRGGTSIYPSSIITIAELTKQITQGGGEDSGVTREL
ncbi:hypothetical protein N7U66_12705 [Lacinutrix neustonica]|uniref:Bacteriocin n=1 Tax=Lacinutrix neustonica TaxID=2980107 RepID=A0A9E8MVG0_9FLAO|nr:hypothetical protein [Lacinutrix neustonica]WAC01035.1 hypothetical protein N7U66_12705 [Lacinutrix neustonica]